MGRKMISTLLALAMVLTLAAAVQPALAAEVWDGRAAVGYAGGSGTRDDPYLIATPGQLALFRNQVNGGQGGLCAKVVADLDLNNIPWTPIGLTRTGYTGIFDGSGWAVRNMRVEKLSDTIRYVQPDGRSQQIKAAGLFGVVGVSGVVKYVNVDGIVTGDISSRNNDAVYIGSVAGSSFGTIEECFSTCSFYDLTISSNDYIGLGGIVGMSQTDANVKNCYYIGTMHAVLKSTHSTYRNQYLGGIAGYNYGKVFNCYVVADTAFSSNSSDMRKGTIAGVSYYADNVINCCYDNQVTTWTATVIGASYSNPVGQNPASAGESSRPTSSMKAWWMPGLLGDVYRYDFDNVNNGYPVLAVMNYGEKAKEDNWYTKELEEANMTEEELNRLVPADLWNKDLTKTVTRAEFAAVALNLYERLSGETVTVQIDNPFTDTSNDIIIKAYQLGITKGTSDTAFSPYSSISRQDMAAMLTRVYKKLYIPGWTLDEDSSYKLGYIMPQQFLDDGRIAAYARDSVYYLVSQNILYGFDGYFYPAAAADGSTVGNATREQAIITSIRYYNVLNREV